MEKRISDVLAARRDVLRLGGYGILGAFADQALMAPRLRGAGRANPRGGARFVVVIELAGAISHLDTFDFKESKGTPRDLDVRPLAGGLYLSHRLFPELAGEMNKVAIVRSMWSHEVVHFRGQYYTQAGRPLNPAIAPEIPSVGSVVASELEGQRRETDTFPTYVGCNLDTSGCGAISTGFLHPRHSAVDINFKGGLGGTTVDGEAAKLLEERYRLLAELDQAMAPAREGRDRSMAAFRDFQSGAYQILGDARWPKAFAFNQADRERYGDNEVGLGCLLARNLIQADAGTRYVHIVHPDWDHHRNIFNHSLKSNHYVRCNEFDRAMAQLLRDLGAAASPRLPGKSLLDETLVVMATEFGRTPGDLNGNAGRHHYNVCYLSLFAGAGVKGGRIIGKTDADGAKIVETGWKYRKLQPKTENIYATIYSVLGIDWRKEILNTPSKRAYRYVDVLGATEMAADDDIAELFV